MWPESVNDISFCMCRIMSKVRVPSLWSLADFVTRDGCRALNLQMKLNIRAKGLSSTDVVRFCALRVIGSSLVSDGKLISLARASIQARRWSDEIRDVDRLPDLLFRCWIVYLT